MKHFTIIAAVVLGVLAAVPAHGQSIEIRPITARPSIVGPAETFTGTVVIDPLFSATASARATGNQVTFEPGARTAWHSHPAGQTLVVTSGVGWIQGWGGERREIRPGDVVWTPPGVKHWHGATVTNGMSHIAVLEAVDGQVVRWTEHVSEEQYRAAAGEPGSGT